MSIIIKWYKGNIGALSKKLRCRKSIAECLSRQCWRTSVGLARALALKWSQEPRWTNGGESTKLRSREFTLWFFSSLGVVVLFNWVFCVATQSHDSKKLLRSGSQQEIGCLWSSWIGGWCWDQCNQSQVTRFLHDQTSRSNPEYRAQYAELFTWAC